jgi:hypothetical protein
MSEPTNSQKVDQHRGSSWPLATENRPWQPFKICQHSAVASVSKRVEASLTKHSPCEHEQHPSWDVKRLLSMMIDSKKKK